MKNKVIWIAAASVGLGAITYFIYDKMKKNTNGDSLGSVFGEIDFSSSGESNSYADDFPIGKGDTGEKVKAIQRFLNSEQSAGLNVDGVFGPATERAWLLNQVCETFATTSSNCWKVYKENYPGAQVGKVDEDFYISMISEFEN